MADAMIARADDAPTTLPISRSAARALARNLRVGADEIDLLVGAPLGVLIVVTNLSGAAGLGNEHIAYGVHLAGIAFALAYYRFHWNLGRLVEARGQTDQRHAG